MTMTEQEFEKETVNLCQEIDLLLNDKDFFVAMSSLSLVVCKGIAESSDPNRVAFTVIKEIANTIDDIEGEIEGATIQ